MNLRESFGQYSYSVFSLHDDTDESNFVRESRLRVHAPSQSAPARWQNLSLLCSGYSMSVSSPFSHVYFHSWLLTLRSVTCRAVSYLNSVTTSFGSFTDSGSPAGVYLS